MRLSTLAAAVAVCLATACGSNTPADPMADPPDPAPEDVTIVRGASVLTTTAFDPNPKAIALAGGNAAGIRWVNRDGNEQHRIMSDDGAFPTSGTLGGGETYAITLTQAGTYRYHCAIHPNMVGSITVTP